MIENDLKDCPFCGEPARLKHEKDGMTDLGWTVECRSCRASTDAWINQDLASEAWNRRQPLECEEYCPLDVGRPS